MSKSQFFVPRNWKKFQHYKDRKPPWIKLHIETLDDYEFNELTANQQLVLIKIWMLYAKLGKPCPLVASWLGGRLSLAANLVGKALPHLLSNNFIELVDEDASIELAPCKQLGPPETYREETYREETESNPPLVPPKVKPKPKTGKRWEVGKPVEDDWIQWAIAKENLTHDAAHREAEKFVDYWTAKTGQKATSLDWFATWRNWIRRSNSPKQNAGAPFAGKPGSERQSGGGYIAAGLRGIRKSSESVTER